MRAKTVTVPRHRLEPKRLFFQLFLKMSVAYVLGGLLLGEQRHNGCEQFA